MAKKKALAGVSAGGPLEALLVYWAAAPQGWADRWQALGEVPEARAIRDADPEKKGEMVREALAGIEAGGKGPLSREDLVDLLEDLLRWPSLGEPALIVAANDLAASPETPRLIRSVYLATIAISRLADDLAEKGELVSPTIRDAAGRLAARIRRDCDAGIAWERPETGFREDERRLWANWLDLNVTIGVRRYLVAGEAWSDAALEDVEALPDGPARSAWVDLFRLCHDYKPSEKWLKAARGIVGPIGPEGFRRAVLRWFPPVDRPRTVPVLDREPWEPDPTHLIGPGNHGILMGLVRLCTGLDDREVARALAKLAASCYRKLPGVGPRLTTLGNACVAALGSMPGAEPIGQLAVLKTRIKINPVLKQIEKALDAAARRAGLPREAVEELGIPTYGMEEVGRRSEAFGEYVATMSADGDTFSIAWRKADGSPLKSVPAPVKKDHAEGWKELQASAKDAAMMLTSRRDFLDSSYLARKTWPLADWRERYLDHPLVGVIARRLIWTFAEGTTARDGLYHEGKLVDRAGRPIEPPAGSATVALWHPIGRPVEEVMAWRDLLERLEVKQPFKQAHREVYLLTDAERRTGTYSNRFAAHVLKQHQFNALCAARGWRHPLRMAVDASYPPAARQLPEWGLLAEFWVESISEEFNESGAFLYLATDQVRFYPLDAPQVTAHATGRGYEMWDRRQEDRPLTLEDVPPMVFSEIMRDVDLFVGVASVGNDPNWSDGGPGGRHVDYWQRFSFGTLSATAQTRKAVLERVVPRLKIAGRCEFTDKFLVVRGDLRTYKIHLGSGNILMEPNDQYLCIVPKQAASAGPGDRVFLPFEGDNVLSVILSKALMLAEDRKIKDPTITSQIGGKA